MACELASLSAFGATIMLRHTNVFVGQKRHTTRRTMSSYDNNDAYYVVNNIIFENTNRRAEIMVNSLHKPNIKKTNLLVKHKYSTIHFIDHTIYIYTCIVHTITVNLISIGLKIRPQTNLKQL